jgi:ribonucleoside-diphosphate reductase alpha subunit
MSSPKDSIIVPDDDEMFVVKRNNAKEVVSFNKILNRVKKIGQNANIQKLNYTSLAMKVIDQLYDNITTCQIDELMAEQCASMSSIRPEYSVLAGQLIISNHQKNVKSSFCTNMNKLYNFKDKSGKHCPLVTKEFIDVVNNNKDVWDKLIDYQRDFLIDYFGFKTLERAYLMRINGVIVERVQHMWLRVSIGIHGSNIEHIKESYHYMSQKYFTHGTPTLFNAGTPHPQLSSCYLIAMEDDSISGIYNTLKDCALISKWSGGIGLHIHNIRASGSQIRGTNGKSNGIVPMLRVFNNTAKYVDQGGGRRNGSFAIYLEPWHADIEMFLQMRKNHGDEELKARDLFYALWIPDLFMERIKANGSWTLMCPDECPGLSDVYGDDFVKLYEKYEREGKGRETVDARQLWFHILDSQMETGTPYLLYKDSVNRKSNQKNVGIIKSSNLCSEITEYSDENETAVCNLASIGLPSFVETDASGNTHFDYEKLHHVSKVVTNNLNKIIDVNFYPTDKTKRSNKRHRPIGIGVQGLADVFFKMNVPFHSEEAKVLNFKIFETIYHGALERSNEIAKERYNFIAENYYNNKIIERKAYYEIFQEEEQQLMWDLMSKKSDYVGAYSTFEGSPASKGLLQFDLWENFDHTRLSYDWDSLKNSIKKYGIRNSLLMAPMPTASTSQILGNNECIEPITSNIYNRRTMAGEFIVANKYMMNDLIDLGLWTETLKNNIIANHGSIQHIDTIPQEIRDKYKTVWEIPMKHVIDMAADRGVFVCQSQSLNLWLEDPNYNTLTSMHFYSWSKGLKTGIYYLRRRGAHKAQQFTIEPEKKSGNNQNQEDEVCEMCSG